MSAVESCCLVEGQGALLHPAYSGVTLGLIHGSAPHAFVLCHLAGQTEIEGYPGHPLSTLTDLVDLHERISLPARKGDGRRDRAEHTWLDDDGARKLRPRVASETGLVADDPVRFGPTASSTPCSRRSSSKPSGPLLGLAPLLSRRVELDRPAQSSHTSAVSAADRPSATSKASGDGPSSGW